MAEKSSELEKINESNADLKIGAEKDTSLQTRTTDDYQSTDLETTDDDATDETEQLRERIVETRREMGETIDAIQDKLSFSNISEQVRDQVSEQISGAVETAKDIFYSKAADVVNTVGRGFKEIGKTDLAKKAKQNPTALAIIGAGVGALLISLLVSGKRKTASYEYDFDEYDFDSEDDEIRYTNSLRRELTSDKSNESKKPTIQTAREKIGDTASSAVESVSDAAGTAYSSVAGAASSAYETVGSAAGKTYEGIGTAAGYTYDKAGIIGGQVKENYNHYIEENPLVVGAVALALGAAVGFAIPLTQKENEYMGEYRDNILEKAQATAQDAIGSVKQMATEAQKVITEEVKSKTA